MAQHDTINKAFKSKGSGAILDVAASPSSNSEYLWFGGILNWFLIYKMQK